MTLTSGEPEAVRRSRLLPAVVVLVVGILLGDSSYGLMSVAATTGRTCWVLVGVLGIALMVTVAVRRLRTIGLVLLALGLAVATAGVMNAGDAVLSADTS